MPRMNAPTARNALVKLLAIGDGKVGKSHYAAMAAKAGFNIFYIDGDVGSATITQMVKNGVLTVEEASRIYLIDARDTILSGIRDSKMVETINDLISSVKFRWSETHQRIAERKDRGEIWEISLGKMGPNDLLVFDSWTSFCESVMLWVGRANGVNVADATTSEMRPVYQGAGLKSTELLQVIRSAPTNVIVLGHPDEFQHTTLKEGVIKGKAKETDQIVDWTKMIAKSTSKPQGLVMPKYFTDVAWMELAPAGNERRLNFKPNKDKVGGGHFTESKSVDEYSFANLFQAMGNELPTPSDPAWITITHIEEGSEPPIPESKVLDGTSSKPVSGMSSLFKKG